MAAGRSLLCLKQISPHPDAPHSSGTHSPKSPIISEAAQRALVHSGLAGTALGGRLLSLQPFTAALDVHAGYTLIAFVNRPTGRLC